MKTVTSKDGFFGTYSADTLVCNAEILPGKADDIGWYASDQKGQVLFVQLDRDIETAKKIRQASPKLAESRETVKPIATAACRETEFTPTDGADSSDGLWSSRTRRRRRTTVWDS